MIKEKQKEARAMSLQAQMEFLETLRFRHHMWANDADNPATNIHIEIASLITQILAKDRSLLALYDGDGKYVLPRRATNDE